MARRTLVVGDIHGCFDELIDLLETFKLKKADRVIAVGDLIVKGEKSREVLDLFIKDERFSAVVGNHDRAIRQFWRGSSSHRPGALPSRGRPNPSPRKPNPKRRFQQTSRLSMWRCPTPWSCRGYSSTPSAVER